MPKRLFCIPEAHSLDDRERLDAAAPTWARVLARYKVHSVQDKRKERVPISEAIWCPSSATSEGAFAIQVPVVDVWRIIASFNPFYANYTNEPNTKTEIHVHDLWLSVPGHLEGQPLVRWTMRPETAFAPYDRAFVPDEAFADAMCGGAGLAPDQMCGRTVYSSSMPGWEVVRVEKAFAFTLIPAQNRCYFHEQWAWLGQRIVHMASVVDYLWDHAEASDLDEQQVPIKVRWEGVKEDLQIHDGAVKHVRSTVGYRLLNFVSEVQSGLQAALRASDSAFVEVEDAVELLMRSEKYANKDRVFWDDDGMNQIVDDWWGLFGPDRARWIAIE